MAKILENPNGGRRMIRLSSDDVMMVITMMQQEFRGSATDHDQLRNTLETRPFYLPEEVL